MLIKEAQITVVPSNTRMIIKENKYCIVLKGTVIVKGYQQTKVMVERNIFNTKGLIYSGEDGCEIVVLDKEQLPENIKQKILHTSKNKFHTGNNKDQQSDLEYLLYNKSVCCPVCHTTFAAKQIRFSKLKLVKRDTDLRMHYKQLDPTLFNVFICPKCHYANLAQDFDKIAPSIDPSSFSTEEIPNSSQLTELELAIENYKLVLQCLKKLNSTPDKIARIYLYLAWLYEDAEKETIAKEMRQEALTYFKQAYNKSSVSNSSQIHQIIYLIAELSLQLGNKKDAYDFFQHLIREKDASPWLVKLARDRFYVLREKA